MRMNNGTWIMQRWLRTYWLKKADVLLEHALASRSLKNKYTAVAGKVEASMQLAYLESPQRLQFVDGKDWAVGLYSKFNTGAGPMLTVFMRHLTYASPHLYFDYKANNAILRADFNAKMKQSNLVHYEGYISSRFDLYAPKDYEIDSLVIAAPDVLDMIDTHHLGADIEIMGNQLYYIFPKGLFIGKELASLIAHSAELAASINDNLSRYRDNRSSHGSRQIHASGKRLVRH
jgi:hypothetical protein